MLTIKEVAPGSVAEQVGLRPGDALVSIDGRSVGDVIDVHFYASADTVELVWQTPGGDKVAEEGVDVGPEGLGLEFTQPTADGIRICNNRCVFCFVDQSPARMRRTLYIKDDDFRYSFLAANFVTLTNLTDDDWQKVHDQHLSPLYVSVHATDLQARRRLLGNPTAPDILEQLDRLASWGIKVHTQVVLTPGYNDGAILQKTVDDLAARWPTVQSLAVVPVGLTQQRFDRQEGLRRRLEEQLARTDLDPVHRQGLEQRTASAPQLRLISREEAHALAKWARPLQRRFEKDFGHTWLYLSDEVYLTAGLPVPGALKYDGFVQLENGIGMVRSLLDDWRRAKREMAGGLPRPVSIILACASLIAPTFDQIAVEMCAVPNLRARAATVQNTFFGPVVTVSGLLTARDILAATADARPGELLFVPRAALDYDARVFLDGITLDELRRETPATVVVAGTIREVADAIRSQAGALAA
ncbi:MAG: Fe-S oxidoreductase, related to NifB/MoaA family with PDZ N-terminal domain [uncultured Chloroflexi bacterium]|uniref:Fe-S oxidoreductase, related to NifB/MoaA family with PDZ N-terminal domain n=1 Tax=uncultured Chloroflexota bacterium TaxID=166587 RepID=A0A6J4JH30_9CHLR|nr:MAG: Fe-S oxidoreductase, related to NifB/MoaA family with PDZ N-terminal domain [uncultured Chloroflexota bacterium]